MNTHTHNSHGVDFAQRLTYLFELLRSVGRAVVKAFDVFSEKCRLVRAYNELSRLDNRTLRDIGCGRGELYRVLNGYPPRKKNTKDMP